MTVCLTQCTLPSCGCPSGKPWTVAGGPFGGRWCLLHLASGGGEEVGGGGGPMDLSRARLTALVNLVTGVQHYSCAKEMSMSRN